MRSYSTKISLTKNSRGIYSLDTSIGCASGIANETGGCYNDCYAAKSAKLYGYDFSKTVQRNFESEYHRRFTLRQINKIPLDFVRIGTSGDPSENWENTISVLKAIDKCNKEIVIITKHWTSLTDEQLNYLENINVCVNTSVSALDKPDLIARCLDQYNRLKPHCKSILRIVSCQFDTNTYEGLQLSLLQDELFKNDLVIDTVLRVNKNNPLVKSGLVIAEKSKFLGKNALISKLNKKTYFGKCSKCHEMCGVKMTSENEIHPKKKGISKQLTIFKNYLK